MQITTFLIISIFLILPIITVNKKFEIKRRVSIYSRRNLRKFAAININFSILSKLAIYSLLAGKAYFSLYILSFIVLHNIALSVIAATISLFIAMILIYIFWNLRPKIQNMIIKIIGFFLIAAISAIFIFILLLFIINLLKNLGFDDDFFRIIKIFASNFLISIIITALSFAIARPISNFISHANFIDGSDSIKQTIYRFFHISAKIPFMVFIFSSYFILNSVKIKYLSHEISIYFLFAFFYSIILINKTINNKFVTPINIIDNKPIDFFSHAIHVFLNINLPLQFIIFLENKLDTNNLIAVITTAIRNQQVNIIFLVGFLYLIVYLIYYFSPKSAISNHR